MPYASKEKRLEHQRAYYKRVLARQRPSDMERLYKRIHKTEDCWLWTGTISNKGYGQFRFLGRVQLAHRASFVLHGGSIGDGLDLDHLCRNPQCVRPDHLEPVTHQENIRRGIPGQLKQVCKRGHELTDDNVYRFKNGKKTCRACALARAVNQRRRAVGQIPWPLPTKTEAA